MRTIALVATILLVVARSDGAEAAADPSSVQFLRDACKVEMTPGLPHFCLGFVEGAAQAMTVNGYLHYPEFSMCPAAGHVPTGEALIQSFMNWSDKHPERRPDRSLVGHALAFAESWPCSKSN